MATRLRLATAPAPHGTARPTIQQLLAVPAEAHDRAWLEQALQWALELELTTIPAYLCALWSIESASGPVYERLDAIAMDEMFHLGLTCNLMTTLGAVPRIASPDTAPKYRCELPGNVHPGLVIGLQKLSKDVVLNTFMAVERPNWEPLALARGEVFATIGALYEAIQ